MGFVNFFKSAFSTIEVDVSAFFKAAETDI